MKTNIFDEVYAGILDTLVVPTDFCEDSRLLKAFLPRVIDCKKDLFKKRRQQYSGFF